MPCLPWASSLATYATAAARPSGLVVKWAPVQLPVATMLSRPGAPPWRVVSHARTWVRSAVWCGWWCSEAFNPVPLGGAVVLGWVVRCGVGLVFASGAVRGLEEGVLGALLVGFFGDGSGFAGFLPVSWRAFVAGEGAVEGAPGLAAGDDEGGWPAAGAAPAEPGHRGLRGCSCAPFLGGDAGAGGAAGAVGGAAAVVLDEGETEVGAEVDHVLVAVDPSCGAVGGAVAAAAPV